MRKEKFQPTLYYNECTKVQNPRYKGVTLNAYMHLSINKNPANPVIIEQCVGVFPHQLDSYLNL